MTAATEISVTLKERASLEQIVGRPSSPVGLANRARVVLLSADRIPAVEIAERVGITPEAVSRAVSVKIVVRNFWLS